VWQGRNDASNEWGKTNVMRQRLPDAIRLALQELKQALSTLYGERFQGMYLYGSYARGDFSESSDVDVLLALGGDVQPLKEIDRINAMVSAIDLRYDLLITVFPIPAAWLRERQSPLFNTIRREGVAL
jgi:predicted nucleotidyltransferase